MNSRRITQRVSIETIELARAMGRTKLEIAFIFDSDSSYLDISQKSVLGSKHIRLRLTMPATLYAYTIDEPEIATVLKTWKVPYSVLQEELDL